MRRHFRLSLRDLLWLTLLCAGAIAAALAHQRKTHELWYLGIKYPRGWLTGMGPEPVSVKELSDLRNETHRLDNSELIGMLPGKQEVFEFRRSPDLVNVAYEYRLSELARRRLSSALERHMEVIEETERTMPHGWPWPKLQVLTAMRRSAGERDPLRIRIRVDKAVAAPCVRAEVENVDEEEAEILMSCGSDHHSGHWRVLVTDSSGKRVPQSNYGPNRISITGYDLEFGDKLNVPDPYDLRDFIAPPRSGIYQVQLQYHDYFDFAAQEDLEGLIYFESQPLTIRVHNPEAEVSHLSLEDRIPLAVAFVPLSWLALTRFVARRLRRPIFARRDVVWSLAILIVGIVWFADQQYLWQQIRAAIPHENATWTIEAVEA
jgi:hypothetical protein